MSRKRPRTRSWARFNRGPASISDVVKGLEDPEAGVCTVLAPTARHVDLRVRRKPGAARIMGRALRAGLKAGALAARVSHGYGRIPAGRPMVVVAAIAGSRREGLAAVETILNALKGVAERWDESSA